MSEFENKLRPLEVDNETARLRSLGVGEPIYRSVHHGVDYVGITIPIKRNRHLVLLNSGDFFVTTSRPGMREQYGSLLGYRNAHGLQLSDRGTLRQAFLEKVENSGNAVRIVKDNRLPTDTTSINDAIDDAIEEVIKARQETVEHLRGNMAVMERRFQKPQQ